MKYISSILYKLTKIYWKERLKREYNEQKYNIINERSIEYSFVFKQLSKLCPRTILDVGTGRTSLPKLLQHCGYHITAIDNIKEYWTKGMFNRHFHIIDDDITNTKINNKFDFIICISVLEHIRKYNEAVDNICSLLNTNGHLVLTFPYNEKEYIDNIYKSPEATYGANFDYICQIFSRKEIDYWIKKHNLYIIEQQYWKKFSGDFWTFGKNICPAVQVEKNELHQLTCLLLLKK